MRLPDSSLASPFADYQPHPFIHLTGYASLDPEHGGAFLGPQVSWNALKYLDLELGGLLSTGWGEIELLKDTYFLSVSWYC